MDNADCDGDQDAIDPIALRKGMLAIPVSLDVTAYACHAAGRFRSRVTRRPYRRADRLTRNAALIKLFFEQPPRLRC